MKIILIILLSAFSLNSFSQNMKVENTREAQYPKGDGALDTLIFKTLKYSPEAKANKVSGEVMISFYVETDSTLTNFRIISDPGYGCGESVKEILQKLKFTPALVNGIPMKQKVIKTVPVYAH